MHPEYPSVRADSLYLLVFDLLKNRRGYKNHLHEQMDNSLVHVLVYEAQHIFMQS